MSSRRSFFGSLAALGASSTVRAAENGDRVGDAFSLRMKRAEYYREMPTVPHPTNGDESRYSNYINAFTKTLLHNPLGEVSREAYLSMKRAISSGLTSDFDAILRGGNVRLKNPMAAFTFQLAGADPSQLTVPAAPEFSSAYQAGDMLEVYWMALARDIPFSQYGSNPLIAQACDDLSRLSDYRGPKENGRVTPNTIFRGHTPGDLTGPYLSQFLLQPYEAGSVHVEQKQKPLAAQDYMTTVADWLTIQLGIGKGGGSQLESTARYMINGRDIAQFVHLDYAYSPYYPVVWMMLDLGDLGLSEDNPYVWSRSQDAFATFGPPDALEHVSRAAKPAFNAAWYQKWAIHLRARPEVFAGRVHHHLAKVAVYPIHDEVLNSPALDLVARKYGTYLLPQAYSEGSPAHSSYPAGHATVAGACITMLKAFYRESIEIPNPVIPSDDGSKLVPYNGPALTVGNELNKLAYNIALGRNFAGIHYRTDAADSIKLGEQVAIELLRDIASTYAEDFGAYHITKFDGTRIAICPAC
jgi:hypothetical protein